MPAVSPVLRLSATGFASLALAMGVGRFAFTPLLPMMNDDELLTISDGGALASVHFAGYWMGALVAARLPMSPSTTLRVSLLAIAATTLGMGLLTDLAALAVLRWIAGVCSAWVLVVVGSFIVQILTDLGRSDLQGFMFSGVGGGIGLVGLTCLLFMVAGIDSSASWQITGMVSLLIAVLLCLTLTPELLASQGTPTSPSSVRRPLIWTMLISYGMTGMGYAIPATYLPILARDSVTVPIVFGWVWPIFGAAAFSSILLAVRLRRRYTDRWIWATSQIVLATGVLLPALYPHMAAMALSGLLVGGTFMIITMVGIQEAHRIAPRSDAMRHVAGMTTAFATGQMIGPVLASSVYALNGNFAPILIGTATALTVTTAALIYTPSLRELRQR